MSLLLKKGADIDSRAHGSQTRLSWAVSKGNEAVVELLKNRTNIDSRDHGGQTSLS